MCFLNKGPISTSFTNNTKMFIILHLFAWLHLLPGSLQSKAFTIHPHFPRTVQFQSPFYIYLFSYLLHAYSRQYFARTLSKANSIAVSLAITRHNDFITILEELPCNTLAKVQWFSALPGQLQHGTIRVGCLKQKHTEGFQSPVLTIF